MSTESPLHFVTFANTTYMSTERIQQAAIDSGIFRTVRGLDERDISDFIGLHARHFAVHEQTGFGLWLWKPHIIKRALEELRDDEILVYCDAGMYLHVPAVASFVKEVRALEAADQCLLAYSAGPRYKVSMYAKADAVNSYHPQLYASNPDLMYGGVIVLRNGPVARSLVRDWLALCENYHFLDKSPSSAYEEFPDFVGQDADNGLFGLVVAKHASCVTVSSSVINLYDSDGFQMKHVASEPEYFELDWSDLDGSYFQYRRLGKPRSQARGGIRALASGAATLSRVRRFVSRQFCRYRHYVAQRWFTPK